MNFAIRLTSSTIIKEHNLNWIVYLNGEIAKYNLLVY